ncbi:FAD/NAD(P)-dependent oxidoreductase [Limobrevibacterium gyesilva]|uniref:NAD(P)/FAD-dependent oxidoreductase n=1 Tax=Limobrevibacterium gyesilva TaxID=2991712 RepID=A0AA41YIC0_9PROT|nr:NAD(P)/FAD-dependent oxidoreductase [Limobrevibacterium gyesilva]
MTGAYDAVVIGAGPAGLAAATLLAERQARVVLVDEQPAPGGQIYRAVEGMTARQPELFEALGPDYAHGDELVTLFRTFGAEYRSQSTVWQISPADGSDAAHEVWLSRGGRSELLQARNVVVATGAMERPVPVPGWTLPGAMTAGAVQVMLKSAGVVPEGMVLAGSGPLLYLLAGQCLALGARITAVLDTTARANEQAALRHLPAALRGAGFGYLVKGLALKLRLRRAGVPIFRRVTDIALQGTSEVTDISFRSRGRPMWLSADLVALHEGVIPAQQITRSIGCVHDWDAVQHCFRACTDAWGNSSVDGVLVAGDGAGIGGARAAEHAGRIAAAEVLRRLGVADAAGRDALAAADLRGRAAHLAIRPFLDRLYAPPAAILRPADAVMVCRCEEVTAGAIRGVVQQGCLGPNQAKSFLRAGMGPCQGRMCGPVVSELIAEARGVGVEEVGYYRIRPPLKPITVGELAALDVSGA